MVPLYSGVTATTRSAFGDLLAEPHRGGRGGALRVDLLVVEREVAQTLGDLDDGAGRSLVAQRLGDAAVDGGGAQAAEQDDDAGLRDTGWDTGWDMGSPRERGGTISRSKRTKVRFYSDRCER